VEKPTYVDPQEADFEKYDLSIEDAGRILGGAFKRFREKVLPPGNPTKLLAGHAAQAKDTQDIAQRRADVAAHQSDMDSGRYGWQGAVLDEVPSMLATAPLGAGLGGAFAKGLSTVAPRAVAGLGGEVAGSAVLSGAERAATNAQEGRPLGEGVGTNMLWGGLGGGVGAGVGSGIGAVAKSVSAPFTKEAQELIRRGYTPTPGQASESGILKFMESQAGQTPVVNAMVAARQGDTAGRVFHDRLDKVLAPLGIQRQGEGTAAISAARDAVDKSYEKVVPQTYGEYKDVTDAVNRAKSDAAKLGPIRGKQVMKGVSEIEEILNRTPRGQWQFEGRTLRDVDIKLGQKIKEAYTKGKDARGDALKVLQENLRAATRGTTPEARLALDSTNAARRELFALERAATSAERSGGVPSGPQLNKALKRNKQSQETALGAVDTGARAGDQVTLGGLLGLANPARLASGVLGAGVYSPVGIRATMAGLRGAQAARKGYSKIDPGIRPGAILTQGARKSGERLGNEDENIEYE
jgi:hypothetical protein